MKKYILAVLLPLLTLAFIVPNGQAAEDKKAQTGFQFLSVPIDARAAAMGEALTTVPGQSSSIFHNPANMALMNSFVDLSVNQNKWIADINYTSGSIALNPLKGQYGVFGLSVISVDYGEFLGTVVDRTTDKGYQDTGNFSPTAFSLGFGYAKALTDRFSVGGQVKYVSQKLGSSILPVGKVDDGVAESVNEVNNDVGVWAYDFGTIFRTGFKSLVFGMTVRNFSQEVKFQTEGFQLPLTFKMGLSMNVFDFFMEESNLHSLLVSVDAIHPRAYSERVNIGAEYILLDMLAIRGGYLYNYDERDFTVGFGFQPTLFGDFGIALDYAYTPFGVFDNVQRMSFQLSF